jgi:hypothetical protein
MMIDTHEIGIKLALDSGVGVAIAAIRRDLETLDRVTTTANGMLTLRQPSDGITPNAPAQIVRSHSARAPLYDESSEAVSEPSALSPHLSQSAPPSIIAIPVDSAAEPPVSMKPIGIPTSLPIQAPTSTPVVQHTQQSAQIAAATAAPLPLQLPIQMLSAASIQQPTPSPVQISATAVSPLTQITPVFTGFHLPSCDTAVCRPNPSYGVRQQRFCRPPRHSARPFDLTPRQSWVAEPRPGTNNRSGPTGDRSPTIGHSGTAKSFQAVLCTISRLATFIGCRTALFFCAGTVGSAGCFGTNRRLGG